MNWRFALQLGLPLMLFGAGCTMFGDRSRTVLPQMERETAQTPVRTHSRTAETSQENRQPPASLAGSQRAPHDPTTRMLIESELKDASPEERAEWIEYLAKIPPNMVPYALRSRRLEQRGETAGGEEDGPSGTRLTEPASDADPPREEDLSAERIAEGDNETNQTIQPVVFEQDAPADEDQQAEFLEIRTPSGGESNSESENPLVADAEFERPGLLPVDPEQSPPKDEEDGSLWPPRFRSLADWDPNRLWPRRAEKDESESPARPHPLQRAQELPQILGLKQSSAESPRKNVESIRFDIDSQSTPTTESPITPGSQLWEAELRKLISLLEAETSAKPLSDASRDVIRRQVLLRLLYLANNESEMAQQPIDGLTPSQQEFWTTLFWGLADYLDERNADDPAERATHLVSQLRSATHHLQSQARLQIRNSTFCERIDGFGNYEELTEDAFEPGNSVLLYCEIRNFQSKSTPEGFYRTLLSSNVEIYEGQQDGKLVDRTTFPPTEDLCRSPRGDYYHSYRIDLPPHLTAGMHVLKLTVQDELSGKITRESIHFAVE